MRFKYILFVLSYIFSQNIDAQTFKIKGIVLSEEDKSPLIGATVVEQGTLNGTTTDLDGKFTLQVASGAAVLEISYVGFERLVLPAGGRKEIEILLAPESNLIEEIIVTGYRSEIRSDISSAITTVKGKDIGKLVVSGIDQALQGQAPGVMVTQVTGSPGDDIAVRIRGVGTLGNNNPLFVIDGIPTTGGLNMFSLSDIESIEVLKDAAAAAVYGARAANGVVLITTKRGKSGIQTFNFEAFSGIQEPVNLPELLNAEEYLLLRNEGIANANVHRGPFNQIPSYNPSILDTLPDVNWLDQVFSPAGIQRYALSASGGHEHGSFYISGEYFTQGGIFMGQGFDRYQLRMNGDIGKKWFKAGVNLSFAHTDRDVINGSGDGFGPGNELSGIRYALIAAPVFPVRHPDGSFVNVSAELGDPILFGDGNANPVVFVRNTDWNQRRYRIFGNAFAQVSFFEDKLKLRTTLGGDFRFDLEKRFKERLSVAIYDPTSLTEGRVFDQTLVWNNTLDFRTTFGGHKLSVLAGMEAIDNHTDYLGAAVNNFRRTDPLFRYIDASIPLELDNVSASGIATEWALLSWFGQLGYSFKNRYVVSAAVRRDGSSRFGPDNRWGTFPSVSFAWNISNEPFFKKIRSISSLKLRASWGQLGNQEIGIYPYSSLVSVGDYVYTFGDRIATGSTIVESGNSNIKWETSTQANLGLDMSIFQDRISITADYFRKRTDDILVRVPVPQTVGGSRPPFVNAASVENKGLELGLNHRNKLGNFSYTIGGNLAIIRNKVLSIANSEPILGGFGLSDGAITKTEPGYPIGSFFLWEMAGIFQSRQEIEASPFQSRFTSPGDVKFTDLNGDKIIDDKDRRHVGNPFPDLTYGITVGFNWGNLDFSTLIQGIQGNDVYFLYGNFAYETQLRGFNSYRALLDRWTPENTDTDIPKVSVDDRNGNRRISTRFLEDGSYMRVRNVTLGYNFKDLLGWQSVSNLRVFGTVQNAFTLTRYPGMDPEIQANANDTRGLGLSSDLAVGIDWGTIPAPRIWTVGVQMQF